MKAQKGDLFRQRIKGHATVAAVRPGGFFLGMYPSV